jgi:hypothetical protein
VERAENESGGESTGGVEGRSSEGARCKRGGSDSKLKNMREMLGTNKMRRMSHSDSKGADWLEILVEGDSIHDKYNEERGQKLPNEGHSRLRVGQRANCDESGGGGRQAQPQKASSDDRSDQLSADECEGIRIADAVGSSESSSDGGVDVSSADVGNGIQNDGEGEAVPDGARSQAVLSGIGDAGSTKELKQERSYEFRHHTLDGLAHTLLPIAHIQRSKKQTNLIRGPLRLVLRSNNMK